MGRWQIFFSANNNEEVMVIPHVPPDFSVDEPQNSETFKGLSRDYNLPGTPGLRSFTLSTFFPVGRREPYMPSAALEDGWQYVEFFRRWRDRNVPMRVVVIDGNGVQRLNMPCTVPAFSWAPRRNGDIGYTLGVTEYVFIA